METIPEDPTLRQRPITSARVLPSFDALELIKSAGEVGPIHLIRPIGAGAMGEVWLGSHKLLGREVAVKFLRASVLDPNDAAFLRFMEGARIAAGIVHPGLNQVYHADVTAGVPYLVLEFLDGCNLDELLTRSGPFTLPVARAILEAVAEAVAELHRRDLVHGDLKPSNVVLTVEGRVVVTDFGLSCAKPKSAPADKGAMMAGTPAYMAPEMFTGALSARTDVYALGISAFEMLCGHAPFQGNLDELSRQHEAVAIDVRPLRTAGVPQALIDVVVRATTKDLLFRPKTARHLLDAFRTAFDVAGIPSATHQELTRVLTERTSTRAPAQSIVVPQTATLYNVIAALASGRRQRRARRRSTPSGSSEPDPQVDPRELTRRRTERRRVQIAAAIACGVGACTSLLIMHYVNHFAPLWNRFVTETVKHKLNPSSATPGRVNSNPPIWVQFIVMVIPPLIAFVGGSLVVSLLLYRGLRGKRSPEAGGITRCGWCEHELRGISVPACSECGHRIGDQGPDEHGQVPLVLQRGYRLRVLLLLCATFFVAVAIFASVGGMILKRVYPNSSSDIPDAIVQLTSFFLALRATIASYEASAQYDLARCGRAWCRVCKGELRQLTSPVCPTCGTNI